MDDTVLKGLVALVPTGMLLWGSILVYLRIRVLPAVLQLIGAAGLAVVALTHVCEALRLLAWMHWGSPHSLGHYVDLVSALVGVTGFPLGYL